MSRGLLAPVTAWYRSTRSMLAAELSQGGWLNFGRFRWGDVRIFGALRAGAGMITPLALGLATNHLEYGVFAALGALPAGMVSFQGVSRTRLSAVAIASLGMAIATFVGGTAAYASGWLLLPAIMVFSYVSGLMATLGQRFLVVGLQWTVQLGIASAIPLAPGDAALRAVLVLAGGLWQGALVVASWGLRRGNRERSALATAYRDLARYAEEHCQQPNDPGLAPPPAPTGADVIHDQNPLIRPAERYRYRALLEEAERLRVRLAALASFGAECSLLEPAAQVLDGLADALEAGDRYHERTAGLEQALKAIEVPPDVAWRWAGSSLLGELRAAVRLLGRLDHREDEPAAVPLTPTTDPRGQWRAHLAADLLAMWASVGTSTQAGRHALRLAVVAGIGEIIAQAFALPRGYWVVLTILIVLRPDYSSTIYRGVQRAAGTVIGAGLGLATALLLHVGPDAVVAAIGVTMTFAYATFAVNYLMFAVFLTDFVVTLMALLGETAEHTAEARLIGTGVGAALALIGYLVWPSWESESAQLKLARAVETQARYASLLLRAYVRPGRTDPAALRSGQLTARRARLEAEASAERLDDEPPRPPLTARLAYGLVGTGRRMAVASLTLHAAAEAKAGQHASGPPGPDQPSLDQPSLDQPSLDQQSPAQPVVDQFADGVEGAARAIAGSLRSLRPPADLPPLRELQTEVYDELAGSGANGQSGHALPGDAKPGDTVPGDTVPGDGVSARSGAARSGAAPSGAGPSVAGPARSAPAGPVAQSATAQATTAQAAAPATPATTGLAGPRQVLISVTDEYADVLDTAADMLRRRFNDE